MEDERAALEHDIQRLKRSADDWVFFEEFLLDDDQRQKIKRARNTGPRPGGTNEQGRPDYGESAWGRMLRDERLQDTASGAAILFRRRFRVPYAVFEAIVEKTKVWHEKNDTDCARRSRIPTALKVLGVLRILGRATCFDGIHELSGIAPSTMCSFFHKFTAWFAKVSLDCRSVARPPDPPPPPPLHPHPLPPSLPIPNPRLEPVPRPPLLRAVARPFAYPPAPFSLLPPLAGYLSGVRSAADHTRGATGD